MRITLEVSKEHESTRAPWWMIINPRQNLRTCKESSYNIANMITGPFFSREEAESVLKANPHKFGRNAVVFCHSGWMSGQYAEQYELAERIES